MQDGNVKKLFEDNVAIIGSRMCSEYGRKIAFKTAKELSNMNINTVSGMAVGIDTYAHLGSLSGKEGKTIAVLANGLAIHDIYPNENVKLFERIIENGGAVVSEYPLGTKPEKMSFPARNRIISGVSSGIIVIEAKEKSGTLITVDFALEQGKEVFAVPGNICSKTSKGTNMLIMEGSNIFTETQDLLI